ncbi:hypothetical protein QML58_10465 [Providencia rettgeri]|nr:hypothetical protein [Providencia rettgeri]MDI7243847.1 hypothetical protein [Providencia rettgeri]
MSTELGKPVFSPQCGRWVARLAIESAGKGGWRKRMPFCNGMDKRLNVPLPETGQTSDWSLIVCSTVKQI